MNNQISDNSVKNTESAKTITQMGGGEVSEDWVILSEDELAEVTGGGLVPTEGTTVVFRATIGDDGSKYIYEKVTPEMEVLQPYLKKVSLASLGYTTDEGVKNTIDTLASIVYQANRR